MIKQYINTNYINDEKIFYINFLTTYLDEKATSPENQPFIDSFLTIISILQLPISLIYIDKLDRDFLLNYIDKNIFTPSGAHSEKILLILIIIINY